MSRTQLDNDNNSDTLLLPDGRKLGYAQYGSQTGRAVLFMHGHPGSRLEAAHLHDLGLKLGARIIAPDRPGVGLSSPQPGRTLLDHPKDLEHLADHLKLESYGVLVRAAWYFPSVFETAGWLTNGHGTGSIRRWTICTRLRFCIT
jgi:pimeloyl-ACP methyl ester carboxylesterase